MSNEREYYYVLRDKQGREVGQVEAVVRGGRFCFEIQTGWDMDNVQEFNVPIKTFKKGDKRERIPNHRTADGRDERKRQEAPK
jgi:hypothetical protein